MTINELDIRQNSFTDNKLIKIYSEFRELLTQLKKRDLPENIVILVNDCIDKINSSTLTGKQLTKFIIQEQSSILGKIEK